MDPDACARYRGLQQEADFALWRAREAGHEMRARLAAALRGAAPAPSDADMQELQRLEADAEAKYRELRDFLRGEFDRTPVTPA